MAVRENFISFLSNRIRDSGSRYKASTINTYANSIDLLTNDLNQHTNANIDSLYSISDVSRLRLFFDELYAIPLIKEQEKTQRLRKTNAFKRYIEFREDEHRTNFNANDPDIDPDQEEARTEGGRKVVISKRIERGQKLRKRAIRLHGLTCKGCDFNFAQVYGLLGEGFIEIHHVALLSEGGVRKTNPKTDLIPLCSNCHRIVHRKRGYVVSIVELKKAINESKEKSQ